MGFFGMLHGLYCGKDAHTRRPPKRLGPSDESLEAEADLLRERDSAIAANGRISMGAVLTAGREMAAESRVRAFLGGLIDVADRGKGHDGRV